jgi:hypothetical protein
VRGFNAFAPAALAGIGHLPGTLHDRSIVIRLVRARPGEITARFDSRHVSTETELCRKLARRAADNFTRLETADPAMPETAYNRLADNWRVLFAIAEAAGADWPARTAAAFAALTSGEDADAQGVGTMLLADIAAAFAEAQADKLPSAKLAEALAHIEGRPWAEFGKARKPISANQLANQLKKFGITPQLVRLGTDVARGYALADFADAFARFLPKASFPECYTVTTAANIGASPLSRPLHPANPVTPWKCEKPNDSKECNTVTPCTPPAPHNDAILL